MLYATLSNYIVIDNTVVINPSKCRSQLYTLQGYWGER